MKNEMNNKKIIRWVIALCAILFVINVLVDHFNSNNFPKKTETVAKSKPTKVKADIDTSIVDTSDIQPVEERKVWNVRTKTDDMTSTKDIFADITSDNMVDQGEPYGSTSCNITVRYMKRYGTDVMINIDQGQIYGNEYEDDNYILVRFDNHKSIKYWFDEPQDGSSETVFIRRYRDFISRCRKAKSIKIELPLYQNGRQIFTFNVDEPLTWKRS